MPKIITFATLKGGAGKTLNLFNLSGAIASEYPDKHICLIDVDPQCNLSANVGLDISDPDLMTIKDVFSSYQADRQPKANNVIIKAPIDQFPNLDIIPSSIMLFNVEDDITLLDGRTRILKNFFSRNSETFDTYDYILIDTNPSMSVFNINAFYSADSIIISTDVSSNSVSGAELFCGLWEAKREQINDTSESIKKDNVAALLVGNYDKRTNLAKELMEYLKDSDFSKDILLDTIIPATVQLKDTEISHMPITHLNPTSAAAESFRNLTNELLRKGVL